MNFNNCNWHDSIIKRIVIDRNNPGKNDSILIEIIWPDDNEDTICFNGVYWANFNMNFGIVSPENVLNAYLASNDDKIMVDFFLRWKGLIKNVDLNCYVIELNSTGGSIKIIAQEFEIC
jgi:hypothetical protein